MFFSAGVKDELAGLAFGGACCRLSELAGVTLAAGAMHLAHGGVQAEVATESPVIARRVWRLIKSLYGVKPTIEQHERRRLNRNTSYRVVLREDGAARKMLGDIGVLGDGGVTIGIRPELVRLSCCEGAFLRGLFLGCGSLSDPGKGYHLEFVIEDGQLARSVASMLAGIDIHARVAERGGRHVVYVKEADHISSLLALTGAHAQMLRFEGVRVEKGVRNSVNRVVNCDTANLDKAARASARQLESIRLLMRHGRYARLPKGLKDAADARLENPEATLDRLAEMLGDVSKSGLNHRFRRLEELADGFRSEGGADGDGAEEAQDQ